MNDKKEKMKKEVIKEIVKKALTEKIPAGFFMMPLLPKSLKKLDSMGIKTKNKQELRSLETSYDDKNYMIFLIDLIDDKQCWAVWEIVPKISKFGGGVFAKEKWIGVNDDN